MSGLFDHWNSEKEKKISGPIGFHFSSSKIPNVIGVKYVEDPKKNMEPEFFPDPSNYEITKHRQVGKYLIVMIKYPNCINYEGNKIMVYQDCTITELTKQIYIDPHFFENDKYYSPIARFVPTKKGWKMAKKFCKIYGKN